MDALAAFFLGAALVAGLCSDRVWNSREAYAQGFQEGGDEQERLRSSCVAAQQALNASTNEIKRLQKRVSEVEAHALAVGSKHDRLVWKVRQEGFRVPPDLE